MTYLMKGSTDWLIEWLKQVFILPTDSRINWLTFWLTITSIGLLIQGLPDWLIDWLMQVPAYWYKGQLTDWLND